MSNLQFNLKTNSRSDFVNLVSDVATSSRPDVHAAAADLSAQELKTARDSVLFVDTTAANNLLLGADTAINAFDLMGHLNLTSVGSQCILTFTSASATVPADVLLIGEDATFVNVQVSLQGAAVGASAVAFSSVALAMPSNTCMVEVETVDVTPGFEVIKFTVLAQGGV
ncbi:MAG: hypothetical protein JKX76_02465 [Colwellia sp.]|nr:hypothetical protein [Colwellia sp.]